MNQILRNLVLNPRRTGAVAPSSSRLARLMAEAATPAGRVLEFGAGTGAITKALLERFDTESLTAFEINPSLARRLAREIPGLAVRTSCALSALQEEHSNIGPVVFVSSLPFKSLPGQFTEEFRRAVGNHLLRWPSSRLVQFTYGKREPFRAPLGCHWKKVGTVFFNLPPATVWVLQCVRE